MSILKTITVDGFYTPEAAINISHALFNAKYDDYEFGKQIRDFNMMNDELDSMFSNVLKINVEVNKTSGFFRIPKLFIHFEPFETLTDWLFVVALQPSIFNIFEHESGAITALDGYEFKYRNLFEWNLKVNHILDPGQGIFFRPWLFHSFDKGLIQMFKVKEI
jgi:hypothetical protein